MGYDAKTIAPQLRAMQPDRLLVVRQEWHNSPEMCWLIDREQAFRARWPDEQDKSPVRAQELAALLTCSRTRADFCEYSDTAPHLSCTDCPYAGGDFYGSLVSPSCTHTASPACTPHSVATGADARWFPYQGERDKEFYDVRTADGKEYPECWPNDDRFHASAGEVIDEKEVTHIRLSHAAE